MMRRSLVAAVAAAPLLAVLAASAARADTTINSAQTTPEVTSATTGDVTVDTNGSVIISSASSAAVTINSNNAVINKGTISNGGVDNTTAVQINGGFHGSTQVIPVISPDSAHPNNRTVLLNNTGTISITESYTATDTNSDGSVDGPFSKQTGGYGVRVSGSGTATGDIINSNAIIVHGNGGIGISIETELDGSLSNILITPNVTDSSGNITTAATAANGSVSVTGDNAIGVSIAKTGHVTGDVILGTINATGVGAEGASVLGAVDGALVLNGSITVTGYRNTATSAFTATQLKDFTADELAQGGPAVVVGADVAKGLVVAGVPTPPTDTSKTGPTVLPDADGNGIPDNSQKGVITVYGSSPAVQVGVSGTSLTLGGSLAPSTTAYGFVNEGTIQAVGVYDQTNEPNLPAPASATAVRIGVAGDTSDTFTVSQGFHNTSSGSISAQAFDANTTGIDITGGGVVSRLNNDGSIISLTTVNNWSTANTATPAAVTAYGILVEQGGSLTSLTNTSTISAGVSGTINATNAGNIGSAYAIKDASGTLVNVANTGKITALVSQTVSGTAPSTGAVVTTPTAVAIDLSQGTAAETITQTQAPDYTVGSTTVTPTATAAAAPAITGDILLGKGADTVNIQAGTVTGAIAFGAGNNSLIIDGSATAATGETTPRVTSVTGAITADGGTLALQIGRGTLTDTSAATINATTVNLSSNATLVIAADPANNKNTDFITTGNSVIGAGATLGVTMQSLQTNLTQQYTIIETAVTGGVKQGSISASTFNAGQIANAPYLFSATASYQAGATAADADKVVLTVSRKTAAQLGFNVAESQAYSAIFDALQHDSSIQSAVLAQTTKSGLITVYDQMIPDQGQGLFDTVDQATQAVANLAAQTPDAGTRVAGSSLWLQEVNERVKRASGATLGSQSQLFGLVGGWEHMGAGGGALGLTLSYMNVQDRDSAAAVGEHTVGSLLEIGGYYRRAIGGLRVSARGAGGYAFFNEDRQFIYTGVARRALSNWGGYFADAHVGAEYEVHLGRFYARPGVSADYLYLRENGHTESGGGSGFDLTIDPRASHRLSGAAIVTLGTQFGRTTWLRAEVNGGYRRIFSGNMGDTTASFTYAGASPFTLGGEVDKGGWYTVGFSIKGGTNLSYLALEGDADFRDGEQRYNLYISGRSMF